MTTVTPRTLYGASKKKKEKKKNGAHALPHVHTEKQASQVSRKTTTAQEGNGPDLNKNKSI